MIILVFLIIRASFMTTTIETAACNTKAHTRPPPLCLGLVVLDNMETPTVLHIEKLGFGGPSATPIRVRIIVRGTPLAQPESFNINFGTSGKMLVDGYTQHMDCRQRLGKEERSGGFPFKVGEQFDVEFIISTSPINTIEVYVNNKFFTKFARYDLNKVTHMEIERAIQINAIYLCPGTVITDIPDEITTTPLK
uniref:Galectin n=1 Tax=Meloidogyne enterolobii TaxID=390850 RepID=A0A6V7XQE0_MELEN|nr:unnamed protein product [Meloidogyne enterolobii]